jgi:hypothetical protein
MSSTTTAITSLTAFTTSATTSVLFSTTTATTSNELHHHGYHFCK